MGSELLGTGDEMCEFLCEDPADITTNDGRRVCKGCMSAVVEDALAGMHIDALGASPGEDEEWFEVAAQERGTCVKCHVRPVAMSEDGRPESDRLCIGCWLDTEPFGAMIKAKPTEIIERAAPTAAPVIVAAPPAPEPLIESIGGVPIIRPREKVGAGSNQHSKRGGSGHAEDQGD